MDATNYLEEALVNHTLGVAAFTMPTAVWVKLYTGDPGEDADQNAATETTRQEATFAAWSGGSAVTSTDLDWLAVAATETYSHVAIWDAVTAGNPLLKGPLNTPAPVTSGGDFSIEAGNLTVSLD